MVPQSPRNHRDLDGRQLGPHPEACAILVCYVSGNLPSTVSQSRRGWPLRGTNGSYDEGSELGGSPHPPGDVFVGCKSGPEKGIVQSSSPQGSLEARRPGGLCGTARLPRGPRKRSPGRLSSQVTTGRTVTFPNRSSPSPSTPSPLSIPGRLPAFTACLGRQDHRHHPARRDIARPVAAASSRCDEFRVEECPPLRGTHDVGTAQDGRPGSIYTSHPPVT